MQKSNQIFARARFYAFYASLMVAFQIVVAQTTACPKYNQISERGQVDNGMADSANISIVLFNTSAGSFSTSTATGSAKDSVKNAMSGWMSMPGNNQQYTVSNYTGSKADTVVEATGTPSNPVVVVEQLSPAGASAQCLGNPACTIPVQNSKGVTIGAIVWVSTDFVNGTPPADYNATFAEILSHEVGAHDDMGWNDCTGANCGNSNSGIGLYTAPGPTPCDKKQFKDQKKTTC